MIQSKLKVGNQREEANDANNSYNYIADENKNITQLIDLTNGNVVNKYDYTPFGALAINVEAVANPFKFSSEYNEKETNLIYYNYRYYNPTDGKWLNRDLIKEDGGYNLYGFIENKVTSNIDFLGLQKVIDNRKHAETSPSTITVPSRILRASWIYDDYYQWSLTTKIKHAGWVFLASISAGKKCKADYNSATKANRYAYSKAVIAKIESEISGFVDEIGIKVGSSSSVSITHSYSTTTTINLEVSSAAGEHVKKTYYLEIIEITYIKSWKYTKKPTVHITDKMTKKIIIDNIATKEVITKL